MLDPPETGSRGRPPGEAAIRLMRELASRGFYVFGVTGDTGPRSAEDVRRDRDADPAGPSLPADDDKP